MRIAEQLAEARDRIPEAAGIAAQLLIDNPAQFGLVAAGAVVWGKILVNLVRPRTLTEALATIAVGDAVMFLALREAMKSGLLRFRVRDLDGHLVPLEFTGRPALSPCPISGCPGHAPGS